MFFDEKKDETNCASSDDDDGGGGGGVVKWVCKICFSNPAEAIFSPCAHMVACCSCVRKNLLISCPICKGNIDIAFKPYLPTSARINTDEKKLLKKKEKRDARGAATK